MLTSVRSLMAATFLAGSAMVATPAMAQDEESDVTVTGSVTLVTDYRFRGVGLSNGNTAIQGSVTLNTTPGFYAGFWGSSLGTGDRYVDLDDGSVAGVVGTYDVGSFGGAEVDLYAGWAGSISDSVGVDVGVTYYWYPDAMGRTAIFDPTDLGASGYPIFDGYADYDTDVIEVYGKIKPTLGPVGLTFGVAYAPDQASLGDEDNLYLSADAVVGIPDTPISLTGHIGYTDGFLVFTPDGDAFDYSVGASVTVLGGLSLGVSYVEVEGGDVSGVTDDTVVGSIGYAF